MATQDEYGRFLSSEDYKRVDYYKEISHKEELHIIKFLEDIYGVNQKDLENLLFIKKVEDVWVTTKRASKVLKFESALTINSVGFRAIRSAFSVSPKITTNFAQFLGEKITKNKYDMNKAEYELFIKGYELDNPNNLRGFCILKYNNEVIGVGLATEGKIRNQLPKGRVLKNLDIVKEKVLDN